MAYRPDGGYQPNVRRQRTGPHPGPVRVGRNPRAARRRRAALTASVLGTLGLLGAAVAVWVVVRPGPDSAGTGTAGPRAGALPPAGAAADPHGLPAAEAGLMPWHLTAPISREVAVAGPGGRVVVLGGLASNGASASGVYAFRTGTSGPGHSAGPGHPAGPGHSAGTGTATRAGLPHGPLRGSVRRVGTLTAPLHDAAAGVSGQHALVFGGGSSASVATVQSYRLPGRGPGGGARSRPAGSGARAVVAGTMPAPRSDAAAVTIGPVTYVVGGYNGTRPDSAVLATTNGRTFRRIATLPVPVRYPAVAALGGQIYVFGGQAVTGPHAGAPLDTIQAIDPGQGSAAPGQGSAASGQGRAASGQGRAAPGPGSARVVGHLPVPLAGAVAVTVNGELFVAGGESQAAHRPVPGLGTTQLSGGWSARSAGAESTTGGSPRTTTVSTIWAFDPGSKRLLPAGRLQVPVSHAAAAVTGSTAWIVGGESGHAVVSSVQFLRPDRALGTAGSKGAGSPFFGSKLLIADRGNNRLLLLTAAMRLVWKYPSARAPRDPLRFYFPDDAFFTNHGHAILSNQEQNDTIVKIAYPSGKIIWSYGHPRHSGTGPGYLHEPDDAYLLRNGQITVADAQNCRVLVINPGGSVAHQIGTDGVCVHNPPYSMGSPNGDTPLANGDLLISEINGSWVSEYTRNGKLVWATQLPISYPSDPQQIGPDRYLIADYASPGQILEFTRSGRILYRYGPASGPGRLNHPSLAEVLPSGVIMVNDDYNHRMVAIDPATGALVWQYGVTGRYGTRPGRLHTPDGFDLLMPNGTTPTHRTTG